MIQKKQLRIALLLDNKNRELPALQHLQKVLQKRLKAKVMIVGSIAEQQRTYFLLHAFQPHIVFISQMIENCVRDFSSYVQQSGGKVCVLPAEITVMKALTKLIINPKLQYKSLITGAFLPGERMKTLYERTDLQKRQLHITGSPKIDVLVRKSGDEFWKRDFFTKKIGIPPKKKNIFIFTSFVQIEKEYLDKNLCFRDNKQLLLINNKYIEDSRKLYKSAITKLCRDFPEYNIIHKPHPLEKVDFLSHIHEKNFFTIKDLSFYNCLESIDLAIHWSSTVATECWIKDIATIQFIPVRGHDRFLSEFSKGNPVLRTYKDLYSSIKIYADQALDARYLKFQQKYLQSNYFNLDGKSADRIASHIIALSNKDTLVSYKKNFSLFYYAFVILEKIFGSFASRRMISFLMRKYNWKYAAHNSYLR